MTDWTMIQKILEEVGCEYSWEEPMAAHTSFQIGGPCKLMAKPSEEEQIARILKECHAQKTPCYVVGKGSNLLVSDQGIDGVVILLDSHFSGIQVLPGGVLVCKAGTPLSQVCLEACRNGLSGLEFAWGIPGSVGGAAYMNAGAYDGEMKQVLVSCRHLDGQGVPGEYRGEELALSYRRSAYTDSGFCITQVTLQLAPGDPEAIKAKMDDLMSRRKSKQPLEYPSAGSTFKRPKGNYASALIDQCGLRGLRVGDAMVSEKHCGFVINAGSATCADVQELIRKVQEIVKEKTGYQLECEVKFLG